MWYFNCSWFILKKIIKSPCCCYQCQLPSLPNSCWGWSSSAWKAWVLALRIAKKAFRNLVEESWYQIACTLLLALPSVSCGLGELQALGPLRPFEVRWTRLSLWGPGLALQGYPCRQNSPGIGVGTCEGLSSLLPPFYTPRGPWEWKSRKVVWKVLGA